MATAKFQAFVAVGADNKLKVNDSVTTVPGIGPGMEAKLKARGVSKVGELMGLFMTFNLDKEAFAAELVANADIGEKCDPDCARVADPRADAPARRRYATEAAEALYEKAMQFCSNELPVRACAAAGGSPARAPCASRR